MSAPHPKRCDKTADVCTCQNDAKHRLTTQHSYNTASLASNTSVYVQACSVRNGAFSEELFATERMAAQGLGSKRTTEALGVPLSTTQRKLHWLRSGDEMTPAVRALVCLSSLLRTAATARRHPQASGNREQPPQHPSNTMFISRMCTPFSALFQAIVTVSRMCWSPPSYVSVRYRLCFAATSWYEST